MIDFFEDWKNRYINNTCTLDHLQRLKNIGKITQEEFDLMLISKSLQDENKQ